MVNPPSNSQLQRAPISFVRSKNSVVHADAVSILKRTTGPTLIYISNPGLCIILAGRTHKKRISCLDSRLISPEVELPGERGAAIILRTISRGMPKAMALYERSFYD
jgi:hypothetical protein